jgi:hypothetical protein
MANPISLCGAVQLGKEVCKCYPPGTQTLMVPTLIGLFAQAFGINLNCQSALALGQQFSCIPANLQLPVLIGLVVALINNGGGAAGQPLIQVFSTVGTPTITPTAATAVAFDNTTIPGDPAAWVWQNSVWTQFLG